MTLFRYLDFSRSKNLLLKQNLGKTKNIFVILEYFRTEKEKIRNSILITYDIIFYEIIKI